MNTSLEMTQSKLFQVEPEVEWQKSGKGIERQIYGFDNTIMLVKVKFKKGAIGELHQHVNSQVTYVESGAFEVTIDNKKKIIKKGDGFYVPPNTKHGVFCLEEGMLIDVFSPMREDFLPPV